MKIYQDLLQEIREVVRDNSLEEVWNKFEEIRESRHDIRNEIGQMRVNSIQIENLEKDMEELKELFKKVEARLERCERKIDKVVKDVDKVKLWVKILTPTKAKIAALALLASMFGGNEALKSPEIKKVINTIIGIDHVPITRGVPIKPSPDSEPTPE